MNKILSLLLKQRHHSATFLVTAEDLAHQPISVNHNASIHDAAEKIIIHNISGIVVNAHDKYGVLSQKDIAKTLLTENQSTKDLLAMQKMQELVLIDQYAPVSNCASVMLNKKTNLIGIKNSHGVKAVMTKHDLVKFFQQNIVDETKLADIMSVGSFFVPNTTALYDALAKMLDNQISRLLIKDNNEKPIGLVTFKSFLRSAIENTNRDGTSVFSTGFGKSIPVEAIMKKQLITVSIQTSLAKVAKILIDYRVHGVAVTQNQKIVGFVTEKDIVRQLARIQV